MALARVQASAKALQSAATSIVFSLPAPPTVGNGLLVPVTTWKSLGSVALTCSDNYGNTYTPVVSKLNGTVGAFIFCCGRVAVTGSPFTLTIAGGSATNFVAQAIEVSGVISALTLDQVASASGSSTAPATGATPALTKAETFQIACHAIAANQASITVGAVSPVWTQEFEQLTWASFVAGEANSRINAASTGTTPSASWTDASAGVWAAVIATFAAGPTISVRATQLPVEVFVGSPARLRATQLVLEVFLPVSIPTRATQLALEVYQAQPARVRATQALVELWVVFPPCISGAFPIDPATAPSECETALPIDPE